MLQWKQVEEDDKKNEKVHDILSIWRFNDEHELLICAI